MINVYLCNRDDFAGICDVYSQVLFAMNERGLYRWEICKFPNNEDIELDISKQNMYKILHNGNLVGAFAVYDRQSPEYIGLNWHFGGRVLELHKIAILPSCQSKGISSEIFEFIRDTFIDQGYTALRWDTSPTSEGSIKMSRRQAEHELAPYLLEKEGLEFLCFEQRLINNCPLLPIKMKPAYRYSKDTPWGGNKLKALFDKDIPSDVCGESLEISCIKNLESHDESGMSLSQMIDIYGASLMGSNYKAVSVFPLLLKYIDARKLLSIQVHPDNNYAKEHENGKLGKEEAWYIISCEPNSKIVYGLKPDVSKELLSEYLRAGKSLEPLVNYVEVKPGDVFYIAPGTLHALGAGIVVYEVQQSSDVTYRMWDWERKDALGNMRQLHIEDSIACIRTDNELNYCTAPDSIGSHRIVNAVNFKLDIINIEENAYIANQSAFSLLSTLSYLKIICSGNELSLRTGDSVFLPANCGELRLKGNGKVLLAKA